MFGLHRWWHVSSWPLPFYDDDGLMMTWADGQGPLPDPIPADQPLKRHPQLPEPAAPTSNAAVTYVSAMAEAAAFYDRWGDTR
jgi:hypothetical protein